MTSVLIWVVYFAVFAFLVHKGRSKDAVLSGSVGFGVQAFAYVSTYISAVALVGFGGPGSRLRTADDDGGCRERLDRNLPCIQVHGRGRPANGK